MYLSKKIVGTHNGIFHEDDVLAVALLSILYDDNLIIKRSRTPEILDSCDILVDVGGGKYDHHITGTLKFREDGTPYASAGLIWKDFGIEILKKINYTCTDYDEIIKSIDDSLIKPVDLKDNGKESISPLSFIEAYLPVWNDSKPDYDTAFKEVMEITKSIIYRLITHEIAEQSANKNILSLLKEKDPNSNIILLPCQNIAWKDLIITHNLLIESNNSDKVHNNVVDFVIFPYPDGGYAAQCVPKNTSNLFSKRIPFPEDWCGNSECLPKISGINDAVFCHINGFFVKAKTLDAIIEMCKKATEFYLSMN